MFTQLENTKFIFNKAKKMHKSFCCPEPDCDSYLRYLKTKIKY